MNLANNHSDPVATHPGRTATTSCNSPAEVRDFLQRIKCNDPEKVLGTAATRGLAVAMIQSTVVTVLVLISCTVVPYVRAKISPATRPEAVTPAEKDAQSPTPEPTKPAPVATAPVPTPDKTTPPSGKTTPPADKGFLDKIGATETKPANPKVNPLDKTTDDLFKDLDKK